MYLRGTAEILRSNVKVKDCEMEQREFWEIPLVPVEEGKYVFTGKTVERQMTVDSIEDWLRRELVLLVHHFLGQLRCPSGGFSNWARSQASLQCQQLCASSDATSIFVNIDVA